jgi:cytochrome c peroxidase
MYPKIQIEAVFSTLKSRLTSYGSNRLKSYRAQILATILLCTVSAFAIEAEYQWTLPTGFHPPPVPANNPMSPAKVELGRHLFYDLRLSSNGEGSCATCHI